MAPPKLQKMLEPLEKALEQCSAEEQAIHKELQSLLPGQPQKQKPHIEVGRGAAEDARASEGFGGGPGCKSNIQNHVIKSIFKNIYLNPSKSMGTAIEQIDVNTTTNVI